MRLLIAMVSLFVFIACHCPQCKDKNRPHYEKACSHELQDTWRDSSKKVEKVSKTLKHDDFQDAFNACDKLFKLPDLAPCQIGRSSQPCWVTVDEILADCRSLDEVLKTKITDLKASEKED